MGFCFSHENPYESQFAVVFEDEEAADPDYFGKLIARAPRKSSGKRPAVALEFSGLDDVETLIGYLSELRVWILQRDNPEKLIEESEAKDVVKP